MKKETEVSKVSYRNWVPGDTFAVKIENIDPKYDGRYFILTLFIHPYQEENQYKSIKHFYVKITKDDKIPTTLEEINALEDVIVEATPWCMRCYPLKGLETFEEWKERTKDRKFIPNEYYCLNSYFTEIALGRSARNFQYIGNFDIKRPDDEFMKEQVQLYLNDKKYDFSYFVKKLIENYKSNNFKDPAYYNENQKKENLGSDGLYDSPIPIWREAYARIYKRTGILPTDDEIKQEIERIKKEYR